MLLKSNPAQVLSETGPFRLLFINFFQRPLKRKRGGPGKGTPLAHLGIAEKLELLEPPHQSHGRLRQVGKVVSGQPGKLKKYPRYSARRAM
jgi:hypothetical protein